MKVHFGKYKDWFGPYQLVESIFFWVPKVEGEYGHKDFPKWVDKIGEWLSETWVYDVLAWIYDRQHRKLKVRVHDYDLWSADSTLAMVILPVLKEFRKMKKFGVPSCNDTAIITYEDETEEEHDKRIEEWNQTIDKMIWSFEQLVDENNEDQFWIVPPDYEGCKTSSDLIDRMNDRKNVFDYEALVKHNEKIQEGLDLFGKNFRNLWD